MRSDALDILNGCGLLPSYMAGGMPDPSQLEIVGHDDEETQTEAGMIFGAIFEYDDHSREGSVPDGGIPEEGPDAYFGDGAFFGELDEELMGSFLSKLGRAITAPITAPVKAAVSIAKGGNVVKAVSHAAVDPFKAQLTLGKTIVKSPIVKVGAGALAVVFPPIGVPVAAGVAAANAGFALADAIKHGNVKAAAAATAAGSEAAGAGIPPAAALAIADKMVRVADGVVKGKTRAQVQAMKRTIKNTVEASKKPGAHQAGAARAVEQMALAVKLRQTQTATKLKKRKAVKGFLVSGKTIKKGVFTAA